MLKKTKKIIGDLWEKIFKRKELLKVKLEVSFLKEEVGKKESIIESQSSQLKLLKSGDNVKLNQAERMMILNTIEYKPVREVIQLPATKAHVRITWRGLRKKIKLSLKEEATENNETKEAKNDSI